MPTAAWIVLAAAGALGTAMIAGAVAILRTERAKRRIQLPARLLGKVWMPPGAWLTLEFPGPDGAPRRTVVFSAVRRGLGATPVFSGWVWVNADDPSDVLVRPRARAFWPVFLFTAAGVVIFGGLLAATLIGVDAAWSSIPRVP